MTTTTDRPTTDDDDRVNIEQYASGRWTGRVLQFLALGLGSALRKGFLKTLFSWKGFGLLFFCSPTPPPTFSLFFTLPLVEFASSAAVLCLVFIKTEQNMSSLSRLSERTINFLWSRKKLATYRFRNWRLPWVRNTHWHLKKSNRIISIKFGLCCFLPRQFFTLTNAIFLDASLKSKILQSCFLFIFFYPEL